MPKYYEEKEEDKRACAGVREDLRDCLLETYCVIQDVPKGSPIFGGTADGQSGVAAPLQEDYVEEPVPRPRKSCAMASPFIEPFPIACPDQWESWVERLEFHFELEAITSPELKRANFCRVCGSDTYRLLASLVAPAKVGATPYDAIMKALRDHFSPQKSELAHRIDFYRRDQGPRETVAEYIAALRTAARDCAFDNLDKALRDRLVLGTRDEKMRRHLIGEETLTLQMALKRLQAAEATKRLAAEGHPWKPTHASAASDVHAADVAGGEGDFDGSSSEDDDVHHLQKKKGQPSRWSTDKGHSCCASCGGAHERRTCRFRDAECRSCMKKGHIARVCRSNRRNDDTPKPPLSLKQNRPRAAATKEVAARAVPTPSYLQDYVQ